MNTFREEILVPGLDASPRAVKAIELLREDRDNLAIMALKSQFVSYIALALGVGNIIALWFVAHSK